MANKFVNIDDLHIDLIDSINPFQAAFEVLSKSVTPAVLKMIRETIESTRIEMTDEEALVLWPKVQAFVKQNGKEPNIDSMDFNESRLAQCLIYLRKKKRERDDQ
jgi:hypothetical protein